MAEKNYNGIILNGIRYEAVDSTGYCEDCELAELCDEFDNINPCDLFEGNVEFRIRR